jgi:hypothetical protein
MGACRLPNQNDSARILLPAPLMQRHVVEQSTVKQTTGRVGHSHVVMAYGG